MLKYYLVSDPEDRDMGARRLSTRLQAFRDEHVKIEMVPLLFGVADVGVDGIKAELKVMSEMVEINELPIRYVVVYGSIFTKFDRKMANELDDIKNYEQLQKQSTKVLTRARELKSIIMSRVESFSPMKNMVFNTEYKASKIIKVDIVNIAFIGNDWRR